MNLKQKINFISNEDLNISNEDLNGSHEKIKNTQKLLAYTISDENLLSSINNQSIFKKMLHTIFYDELYLALYKVGYSIQQIENIMEISDKTFDFRFDKYFYDNKFDSNFKIYFYNTFKEELFYHIYESLNNFLKKYRKALEQEVSLLIIKNYQDLIINLLESFSIQIEFQYFGSKKKLETPNNENSLKISLN